jgi:hypothetical protein
MFLNDEISVNPNEGIDIDVTSFSLSNSMYNANEFTENFNFKIRGHTSQHHHQIHHHTVLSIPYGNYSVYVFMDKLNEQLQDKIQVICDIATNPYTYERIDICDISIMRWNAPIY